MTPNPGDRVRVERAGVADEGVLMPSSDADHLVLKLDGGYNVGVDRDAAAVELLERDARDVGEDERSESSKRARSDTTREHPGEGDDDASAVEFDDDLPTVALISTGGTIASTVDYRTGAVTARFDAEDVLRAVPDLAGRANYRGRVVANILSENMEPRVWRDLAEAVREEVEAGDTPVPVVFTGSQRSADRPSSDNVMNAVCAVEAAKSDCSEVLVCMHATPSDDHCALHRGTRVRKNHTSRRDAFETVGARPLGRVTYGDEVAVEFRADTPYARRGDGDLALAPDLADDVELVKFTPGMDPAALGYLDGKSGVVIEGTGLGHVHTDLIPRLEALVDDGTTVVMTSQCLEGRVCDRVYDTGRDLLEAGVVEAGDTLPGTATVKLMWALANVADPADAMGRNLAGELTAESRPWG
ncbi:Glu-tRNA(Gln) amidotransferase GatDE subunit D [Halobacteriales archaeon QS_6_71_20]|nr:MAG: Glu-tRNA(Gln) amidotransferase GatDE subunit D [Halobacteriales archaeon QS_6_71_20]